MEWFTKNPPRTWYFTPENDGHWIEEMEQSAWFCDQFADVDDVVVKKVTVTVTVVSKEN